MKQMEFRPIYGFGWREDRSSINPPEPFLMEVESYECSPDRKFYSAVRGTISGTSHKFHGKWVVLTIRGFGKIPDYNVRVYDDPPSQKSPERALASGFAELSRVID